MSSAHEAARRRMIQRAGRSMLLTRPLTTTTGNSVALTGFLSLYKPDQVGEGGIKQGDAQVATLYDEMAQASWPAPPLPDDVMQIDGAIWRVMGATPVYDSGRLIGFLIWVRGG